MKDGWRYFPTGGSSNDLADWIELKFFAPLLGMSNVETARYRIAKSARGQVISERTASGSSDVFTVMIERGSEIDGIMEFRRCACGQISMPDEAGQHFMFARYSLAKCKTTGEWTKRTRKGPVTTTNLWTDDVYLFLLLATRVAMNKDRMHDELDGSQLFEHLCAVALRGFFGPRCEAEPVGAREISNHDLDRPKRSSSFYTRLAALAEWLNQGSDVSGVGSCHVWPEECVNEMQRSGDGGIDVAVKLGFSSRPVRDALHFFAQCKTGTTYTRKDASDLLPERFVFKYFRNWQWMLPSSIGRLFMIADHPPDKHNDDLKLSGCTVFDRCRVLEALTHEGITEARGLFEGATLLDELRNWNQGTLKRAMKRKAVKGPSHGRKSNS